MHIWSDFNSGCIHKLYHDEQDIIDEMFCQYIKPLFKDIDHTALIRKWKQNIDAAVYGNKLKQNLPSKKKEINLRDIQS